ncbi:hypothetical protein PLESTB_000952900 [Pleodorina starrii]|uniref:Protein kinase domain-containing protein n=1 Tax=Pleodorina starrii TaxID=330485 RepID=A0A9W6F468_9CHLO|nr:hypothetical protein PLESTM_001145700 [Pleodorina starrii]GLC55185.1 hypothetical protein PLESTB_000952900 [Pleodorina starrii]GLC71061.1 hypothetical protein PLESTF_001070500 [Pleodorina starrii]
MQTPKQILLRSASFLALLASRHGALENISRLAVTALFWQLSIRKHKRRGVLALVAALQLLQTALICGVHILFHPDGVYTYNFVVCALCVGILAPAIWLLPGVLWSGQAMAQRQGGAAAAAAIPPADAAFLEALRRINERGEAPEDCSCPPVGPGFSGRCRWHSHPGVAADAATAAATTTAALRLAAGRDVHFPQLDASSLRPRSDDPLDAPVGCTAAGACSPWRTASQETLHDGGIPGPAGPRSLGAATTTTACQTDDELLLWLFTGGSTAPSAADEVRDEPRASYSGLMSPNYQFGQPAEPWGPTAKDGPPTGAVSAFADGSSRGGCRWSGGGGDHESSSGGGDDRCGGVGKHDSFTSVWSRCAGGRYGKGPSGRVSIDVAEVPVPAPGRPLEEGRLSNGSQQGTKAGRQGAGGQAAPWLHLHAPTASKHCGAALASMAMPAPLQLRGTVDGARGCGVGGAGIVSPAGPPTGDLVHYQNQNQQQLQSQAVYTQLQHQSSHLWPVPPHVAAPHHQLPHMRLSPGAQPPSASVRRYSGFGEAGRGHGAPAAVAAAAEAAFGLTAATAVPRPGAAYDCQVAQAATERPAAAARVGASAETARESEAGTGPSASAAVASRSLARRQRLQRSRTFTALSPERSRVLVELATTDGGSPSHLPPPELDEQRLGSQPIAVPSPYSEESEDEAMQQLRALRALRRSHPELAISLDRFAAISKIHFAGNGAATAVPVDAATGGPARALNRTSHAAAVPEVAAAVPREGSMGLFADAGAGAGPGRGRAGGRRMVLRTRSFSNAAPARGAEEASQHEPPLQRSIYTMHQQLLLWRQQQQEQLQAQGVLPSAGHSLQQARAVDGTMAQPVHASEPTSPSALSSAVSAPAAGATTTSSDGLTVAGSVALDRHSELFLDQQLPSPAAVGSSAGAAGATAVCGRSRTSSRPWSSASSSVSATTLASRRERPSMSVMEVTNGPSSGDSHRASVGASAGRNGGAAAAAAAAATCAAAAAVPAHSPECGGRVHHVQRSRSAGETGFRSGDGMFAGGRRHWSQLPHQEHRRASLMQAWQAMMAAEPLTAAAGDTAAAGPSGAGACTSLPATVAISPNPSGARFLDSDSALLYGADPHGPPTAEVASAHVAGAGGHSPTSPPARVGVGAAASVGSTFSSCDGSGYSAVHLSRAPGAAADPAAAAAGDDRSVRLCKSLSERSLQRVASNHHFRRLARTKSRFALVQQESSGGSAGGASGLAGGALPRISSGGSAGSRTLENVLEEQEEDVEEGLAAAVGSARGSSLTSRHSAGREIRVSSSPGSAAAAKAAASPLASQSAGISDACSGGRDSFGGGSGAADAAFAATVADSAATNAAAVASRGLIIDAAAADVTVYQVGAVGGSPPHHRTAWRSASELSFAGGRTHAARPERSSLDVGGCGGSDASGGSPRCLIAGDRGSGSRGDRRSMDSADLARATVDIWPRDGDESIPSRVAASIISIDGLASLPPSLLGSNGSSGGAAAAGAPSVAGMGGASTRLSGSGIAHVDSLLGLARHGERVSLARGSSVALGSVSGIDNRQGDGSGGAGGGDKDTDSDQELLDVLADEAAYCGPVALKRLREQGSGPGKTASFRFAAPIVPLSLPPPLPPAVPAALAAPGLAAPYGLVGSPDPAGGASAAAAAPAASAGGDDGGDDIPVPPLADPVLPEVERERERSRSRTASPWALSSASDAASVAASGSPPASDPLPAAVGARPPTGAPAATAAAATAAYESLAPLSAQNLHNHTRHWEAASPDASDPVALVLQLPSPSPSQSGPIDPLSDGDGAPSPALLAVLNTSAAAAAAAVVPDAAGGSSSLSSSPPRDGVTAGLMPGGPVPRAVFAARLSMPLLPYSGPDTAALVSAAARNSTASGLSCHTTSNTISGLSVCESAGSLSDAAAAAAALMQSGHDVAVAAAAAEAAQPHTAQRASVASHSPSMLVSGSNAGGRNVMLRVNSGGAAGSGASFLPRPNVAPSTVRQPSKLSAGAVLSGGEVVEAEVEESVLANRRVQDERGVLLEEIHIDKVLGFGSMGMVYHGRLYDTKVVVKLIEHGTGVLGKEKERGRLARVEACLSRMLLHPNVVLTYDACTGSLQPGRLAAKLSRRGGGGGMGGGGRGGGRQRFMTVMVQEFCELGTLKDALGKRKHGLAAWVGPSSPSPESLTLLYRVALDIANGMKYLAALRIIHADLKAENVLLQKVDVSSDRPHGFTAKVADFGLAMVLAPGEDEMRQGIHGTVSHMPPEAMRDTCFSLATDVFSFGVVLWELYTTESPYRGMAPHEVVEAICVRDERPCWPGSSPPDLVALAEDCWHADPHHRPSFADVVERLRQLLAPTHGPPERSTSLLSGLTEESDELELALRQQRRGAPAPSVRGGGGAGGAGGGELSETGSEFAAASGGAAGGRYGGMPTRGSSHGGGANTVGGGGDDVVGVPRAAPRDPLGLLLWALCQFPGETSQRVAGPLPDSEQWVLQVEDIVLKSRQQEHEEAGTGPAAAAAAPGTRGGSAAASGAGASAAEESLS